MKSIILEKKLSNLHHSEYCLFTGNATTALYLILKTIGYKNEIIGFPNSVCINVPLAIIYSGNIPMFLDVDAENFGISLEKEFQNIKKCKSIITVHAYGVVSSIEKIKDFCLKENIFLIEDAAASQGAKSGLVPVGAFGDVSVLSFGSGKIIDVGHGGALLTNNKALYEELVLANKKLTIFNPMMDRKLNRFGRWHTKLYNKFLETNLNNCYQPFKLRFPAMQKFILHGFDESFREVIAMKIKFLSENIQKREENALIFKMRLKEISQDLFIPAWVNGSVFWRFNVFLKKKRNYILKSLLAKKYKVSSWFPSVDLFFRNRESELSATPVSDKISNEILNFWVNDEIDNKYIDDVTRELEILLG